MEIFQIMSTAPQPLINQSRVSAEHPPQNVAATQQLRSSKNVLVNRNVPANWKTKIVMSLS